MASSLLEVQTDANCTKSCATGQRESSRQKNAIAQAFASDASLDEKGRRPPLAVS